MAVKWLALRGPFTADSWQALNGRQMATLKRAICDKKWLAMLPFLPFVALTETTNGPFMSCLLGYCTLRKNLQRIFHQNTKLSFHEHTYEDIVCEMVAILSWRRWFRFYPAQKCSSLAYHFYMNYCLRWWSLLHGAKMLRRHHSWH